jgi:hypothetical protein
LREIKNLPVQIKLLWISRFGKNSFDDKCYLENNLPTVEMYSMQGREHKQKAVGNQVKKAFSLRESVQVEIDELR